MLSYKKKELNFAEINHKILLWEGKSPDLSRKSALRRTLNPAESFTNHHEQQVSEVTVSRDTFKHVYKMGGGIKTFVVVVLAQFTVHYLEVSTTSFKSQWTGIDEGKNFDDFVVATLRLVSFFLLAFVIEVFIEIGLTHKIKSLSKCVHDEVLNIILHAPINLYFDVTSVGVILNTYQRDIETFNGGLLKSLHIMMKLVSWLIAISIFISAISGTAFVCFVAVSALIIYYARVFLIMNRQMLNLDCKSKEPIVTSLADALNGRSVL